MADPFANSVKFITAVNLLSSPHGVTIKGLMKGLGISRRSVFRLLQVLEELGFPLIDDHRQARAEKTYRLLDSYVLKLPNITILNPGLTGEDIELILSVLDFCRQFGQVAGNPRLNVIKKKIMALEPKEKVL